MQICVALQPDLEAVLDDAGALRGRVGAAQPRDVAAAQAGAGGAGEDGVDDHDEGAQRQVFALRAWEAGRWRGVERVRRAVAEQRQHSRIMAARGGGHRIGEEGVDDLEVVPAPHVVWEEVFKHLVELCSREAAGLVCVVPFHYGN